MGAELSGLEERIANTDTGAITSIQAVYVPADDFHRPCGRAHLLASLGGHRVVAQAGERGPFPGGRPAAIEFDDGHGRYRRRATLRLGADNPANAGASAELKDIIAMLGLEQLSPKDRSVVNRARRLERFLTQPFFTTEQFAGLKGKLVGLKDALDGCERIPHEDCKDCPESALYMIGTIEEVKAKSPLPTPMTERTIARAY